MQSSALFRNPLYLTALHLLGITHQPVGFLIERAHQTHQGYGIGIAELFRQLSQVDTGLLKVEGDGLEVAAQLLVWSEPWRYTGCPFHT
jgi:hypothetical protein